MTPPDDVSAREMDEDQAAAILGAACDSHFDVPCEGCGGAGVIGVNVTELAMYGADQRECPTCKGDGVAQMPDADDIQRAAQLMAGEVKADD